MRNALQGVTAHFYGNIDSGSTQCRIYGVHEAANKTLGHESDQAYRFTRDNLVVVDEAGGFEVLANDMFFILSIGQRRILIGPDQDLSEFSEWPELKSSTDVQVICLGKLKQNKGHQARIQQFQDMLHEHCQIQVVCEDKFRGNAQHPPKLYWKGDNARHGFDTSACNLYLFLTIT